MMRALHDFRNTVAITPKMRLSGLEPFVAG